MGRAAPHPALRATFSREREKEIDFTLACPHISEYDSIRIRGARAP
jgi:hypothetical protein